jgi:hypothetical protein
MLGPWRKERVVKLIRLLVGLALIYLAVDFASVATLGSTVNEVHSGPSYPVLVGLTCLGLVGVVLVLWRK